MHVPPHPPWFWLVLSTPFAVWLGLWAIMRFAEVSLKPLGRWFAGIGIMLLPVFLLLDAGEGHRTLRFVVSILFYSFWTSAVWIGHRYRVESLAMASRRFHFPWQYAEFTIPTTLRIHVRNIEFVTPWYKEKLGLRESATLLREPNAEAYQFKKDGNFVVFTNQRGLGTEKTPILFTRRIERMWRILSARGVQAGTVEKDRQGTRYFEIHDPEGNLIEIVEEPK